MQPKGGTSMKSMKFTLALVGFAATLFAADPFVGTWKLNAAKTKYKVGTAPKEQTIVITEAGADLHVKISGTSGDGKPFALSYSVPAAGGAGKFLESAPYDSVEGKRHGTNERELMYKKGGKTVYTAHPKITTDGNTMSASAKGMNPAGQKVESESVYDKQK
jgi:hypothetical protein